MSGIDKRKGVRVSRPIEVKYSANCPPIQATMQDLSDKGMFLDTQHSLHIGDVISFEFDLPGDTLGTITGRGRVVWVEPLVGVGVKFLDLSEDIVERIRFWVAGVFFGAE